MRLLRWLLAAVTLSALLGMHALMGPDGAAGHTDGPATHSTALAATASATPADAAGTGCRSGACHGQNHHEPGGGHSVAHLCLAVLAGAVALLVTVALGRSHDPSGPIRARLATTGQMSGRAPPWTQPSLAQLSVLRV